MEQKILDQIIEASGEVHQMLGGAGLLENIYETALCYELQLRGLTSQRQLPIPVVYKGICVREPLFLDILVEKKVIIEVKATGKEYPIYRAQLLTYLRLTHTKIGILVDFGRAILKDGICIVSNR